MTVTIELRNLPQRIKSRPDVRALTLRVYPTKDPRRFQVPGRTKIYDVYRVGGVPHCECVAAAHGRICAHAIAVERYHATITKEKP